MNILIKIGNYASNKYYSGNTKTAINSKIFGGRRNDKINKR